MSATPSSHTSTHPLRAGLATLALVSVGIVFALQLDASYPLEHWLFFRYLEYWGLCAGLACACTLSGLRVTAALGARSLSFAENLLISFASGVLLFGLGIFVGGILGLYGPIFFVLWPVLLTLLAGRAPWHTLAGAARSFSAAARCGGPTILPRTPFELARATFLVLGLIGIYLQAMWPVQCLLLKARSQRAFQMVHIE